MARPNASTQNWGLPAERTLCRFPACPPRKIPPSATSKRSAAPRSSPRGAPKRPTLRPPQPSNRALAQGLGPHAAPTGRFGAESRGFVISADEAKRIRRQESVRRASAWRSTYRTTRTCTATATPRRSTSPLPARGSNGRCVAQSSESNAPWTSFRRVAICSCNWSAVAKSDSSSSSSSLLSRSEIESA